MHEYRRKKCNNACTVHSYPLSKGRNQSFRKAYVTTKSDTRVCAAKFLAHTESAIFLGVCDTSIYKQLLRRKTQGTHACVSRDVAEMTSADNENTTPLLRQWDSVCSSALLDSRCRIYTRLSVYVSLPSRLFQQLPSFISENCKTHVENNWG